MDGMSAAGLEDRTAVFVSSDHGDFAGDYGLIVSLVVHLFERARGMCLPLHIVRQCRKSGRAGPTTS